MENTEKQQIGYRFKSQPGAILSNAKVYKYNVTRQEKEHFAPMTYKEAAILRWLAILFWKSDALEWNETNWWNITTDAREQLDSAAVIQRFVQHFV